MKKIITYVIAIIDSNSVERILKRLTYYCEKTFGYLGRSMWQTGKIQINSEYLYFRREWILGNKNYSSLKFYYHCRLSSSSILTDHHFCYNFQKNLAQNVLTHRNYFRIISRDIWDFSIYHEKKRADSDYTHRRHSMWKTFFGTSQAVFLYTHPDTFLTCAPWD